MEDSLGFALSRILTKLGCSVPDGCRRAAVTNEALRIMRMSLQRNVDVGPPELQGAFCVMAALFVKEPDVWSSFLALDNTSARGCRMFVPEVGALRIRDVKKFVERLRHVLELQQENSAISEDWDVHQKAESATVSAGGWASLAESAGGVWSKPVEVSPQGASCIGCGAFAESELPAVQCGRCKQWLHQVCVFPPQHDTTLSDFFCHMCRLALVTDGSSSSDIFVLASRAFDE